MKNRRSSNKKKSDYPYNNKNVITKIKGNYMKLIKKMYSSILTSMLIMKLQHPKFDEKKNKSEHIGIKLLALPYNIHFPFPYLICGEIRPVFTATTKRYSKNNSFFLHQFCIRREHCFIYCTILQFVNYI